MTLRRRTPPTWRTLSPLKVRTGCRFRYVLVFTFLVQCTIVTNFFLPSSIQRSPSAWMSQTASLCPAVTTGRRIAFSPQRRPPAAVSPSTSLRFTNRRGGTRTKAGGKSRITLPSHMRCHLVPKCKPSLVPHYALAICLPTTMTRLFFVF